MNNLRKIGLSALAASLATFSVNAAEVSVSGGASLSFDDTDRGEATRGNGFYMGDSLGFNMSGETENGLGIAVYYEIDAGALDDYDMTVSGDWGSVKFNGSGSSSAFGAVDDVTPNAYEESWDVVSGADTGTTVNGSSGNNMFTYKSPDLGGATVTVAYLNASDAGTDVSYMDFSVVAKPEMVEGLEVGYGFGETEETTGTAIDESAMYVKYTYGSVTVGYQVNEADGPTSATDLDFEALGISYAVTDDLTIGYSTSESDKASDSDVQEATAIGASYTSGGITVAGSMNSVDNVGFDASADRDGYEFNVSFAF